MLKKEVKTSTGLIIIFAAAVIIFGGCYTWAAYKDPGNYSSPAVVTSSVKKAATSTTATPAATDETKDWQTYENKTYAYSIKYPKDWYIETDNSEKAFSKRGTEGTLIGGDTAWSNYQNFDFTLDTLPADRQLVSLMIYSDRSDLDTFIANDNRRKYALTEKKNLKIDGKDAVQYLVTFIDVPTGVQERVTLIKNNDQIFRLSYGVIKNKDQTITYSDMVGSIKFADTTADWQTYKNDTYGFSFKYPKDWTVGDYVFDGKQGLYISNYKNARNYDKSNAPTDLLDLWILPSTDRPGNDGIIKSEDINGLTVYSIRSLSDLTVSNRDQILSSTTVYAKEASFITKSKNYVFKMASLEDLARMAKQVDYFNKIISTFQFTK